MCSKSSSIEYLCFFSNKCISYVASYVGPIQTGFLRGFQKSSGRTEIVIPVKKVPQNGKHRNPEDSCRNYQPSIWLILF
jgi:hypothetical protein